MIDAGHPPFSPPLDALRRGEQLARRHPHALPINDIIGPDRKVVARWSDGRHIQPVETITWLSPDLLARWTGFSPAPDPETWSHLRRRYLLTPSVIVELTAYPKERTFGLGDVLPSNPKSIENPRILLLLPGAEPIPGTISTLAHRRGRTRPEAESFSWFHALFLNQTQTLPFWEGRFGDYHRHTLLVQFPGAPQNLTGTFAVRVETPGRDPRVAAWRLDPTESAALSSESAPTTPPAQTLKSGSPKKTAPPTHSPKSSSSASHH